MIVPRYKKNCKTCTLILKINVKNLTYMDIILKNLTKPIPIDCSIGKMISALLLLSKQLFQKYEGW